LTACVEVEIFSISGIRFSKYKTKPNGNKIINIELSGLNEGVYLLRFSDESGIYSCKFLKK